MKKVKVHAGIKLRAEFADVMGVHAGSEPSLSVGRGYALSDLLGGYNPGFTPSGGVTGCVHAGTFESNYKQT